MVKKIRAVEASHANAGVLGHMAKAKMGIVQ